MPQANPVVQLKEVTIGSYGQSSLAWTPVGGFGGKAVGLICFHQRPLLCHRLKVSIAASQKHCLEGGMLENVGFSALASTSSSGRAAKC